MSSSSDSGLLGDHITNATTPTVTGTAAPNATVRLYDTNGTTLLGSTTADGSGNWGITSSLLSEGSHSLKVTQTDGSSNTSPLSTALSLTIDTTAPATPGTPPVLAVLSDSGTLGDNVTNLTTPTVTGTAEIGSTVKLYDTDGTTLLGTAVANGSGNYSIVSSTLSQGVHSLTVKAVDPAGNVSGASTALSLTIDTTAPATPGTPPVLAVLSDSGTLGDNVTNLTTPTVTGTAEIGSTVKLYDTDGTTLLGTAVADSSGNYSIVSSTLSQGVHSLTVKAVDPAGNVSGASTALSLTIDTTALAPQILALASNTGAQSGFTNVTTPTVTGTAEPGSIITLYEGATLLGTAAVALDGTWAFTSGALAEGLHQITASVADLAGNVSPISQVFALTIDTIPPVVKAALLNDTGSSTTDRITADATLTGSGDPNALVTVREGNTVLGATMADGQGGWMFTPKGLAVGVHNLAVSETDAAGNTSTAQVGLRLDAQSAAAPSDFITASPTSIGIARFFDTVAGTTFYTSSMSEYNATLANRPDLKLESNDLNAINPNTVATDPDAVPVYRFFDTTYGTHFFTASAGERDGVIASRPDMRFEGVGFFEHTIQQAGDTAVYRFFETSNGTHFYTTNETERASILSSRPDMVNEGIGFYAPKIG